MANGYGGSKLAPLWLAVGGGGLVLAMMAGIIALRPLDFSPPKTIPCEGESCAGHDSAPRPTTSHAGEPAGHHE